MKTVSVGIQMGMNGMGWGGVGRQQVFADEWSSQKDNTQRGNRAIKDNGGDAVTNLRHLPPCVLFAFV